MLRLGEDRNSFSQVRIRGCPALLANSVGMPLTGSA
jgi:hypothetical protein